MILNQTASVIPIRPEKLISDTDKLTAELGFELWLSSAFRLSPENALLTSLRILTGNGPAGLFLVPKRTLNGRVLSVMKRHSGEGSE